MNCEWCGDETPTYCVLILGGARTLAFCGELCSSSWHEENPDFLYHRLPTTNWDSLHGVDWL